MRTESQVGRRRRRAGRAAAAVLLALTIAAVSGCGDAVIDLNLADRGELGERALSLLERAAQLDVDVVACHAIEALTAVAPAIGKPLFREATRAPSPLVRFAACAALGELRDATAIDDLARCQRDPERRVRLAATYAAYRCGAGDPQLLFQTLAEDADENLRADAAYLIGRLGQKAAITRLRAATNDKSNKVVVQVYGAMARLGDKPALDQLINFAAGDVLSRAIALQELADIGDERARDALLYRFASKEDYIQIRLIAARGLGRLGSRAGFDFALAQTRFSDKDETETMRVRSLAALALGSIGDPRALAALRTLAESNDERVQVAACYAICQITRPARATRAAAGR